MMRRTEGGGAGSRIDGVSRRWVIVLAALAALAASVRIVEAQTDTTVVVVPGPEYAAGEIKRRLLGDDYRRLWTAPIRVPVLNLRALHGGLVPVERGGGKQTRVLHLRDAAGREFVFRSVNKDPALIDEPALHDTPISAIVQDQVSSLFPSGALVVPPLLEAVGVMHPSPVLVVMPDDPLLGEFREEFAGLLGWVEERPDEIDPGAGDEARPGFGGYQRITGTERLLERIEESPEDRVDARKYLTARLIDLVIGDWDRHYDQWRWAEEETDSVSYWLPIPRDRDYVMVNYDGPIMAVASRPISNIVSFESRIRDLSGLLLNARDLDRRLLAGLSLAEWDSITGFVQARLTDEVIAEAVGALPPEHREINGEWVAARLRSRRDALGSASREFYAQLASDVDVRGTDEDDLALIDRLGDGVVRVALHERGDGTGLPAGSPYYQRTFYSPETSEVRVYLHGGDDQAVVRGDVRRTITVRVIGGGGDDLLVDSSAVRLERGETAFYDARGENRMLGVPGVRVDERPYDEPEAEWSLSGESFRDWGGSRSIAPVLDYRGTDGPIIGAGPVHTDYGFRKSPYAHRIGAIARIGLMSLKPAIEVFGDFRRENSPWGYGVVGEASRLENFRFFGFGNDTRVVGDRGLYTVAQDQISLRAYIDRREPRGLRLTAGPVVMYTNPDVEEGGQIGTLPRYGNGGFGQLGGWIETSLDRSEDRVFPRHGFRVRAGGEVFPGAWSADGVFGSLVAQASTYLTPSDAVPATLALRGGAEKAMGEFPVHESAFLGGSRSLRGYSYQRFAGDLAAYGNAELRVPITRAVLLVRGTLGAIGLADAGRVWYHGESDGGWHTSLGGGLSFDFELRGSSFGATALYARGGEGGRFYLMLGAPF